MLEFVVELRAKGFMDNYYPALPGLGGYRFYTIWAGEITNKALKLL
jgi:hypothetical protein